MNVLLRDYRPDDVEAFARIHFEAVHALAKSHYDKKILDDWAPPIDQRRLDLIEQRAKNEIRIMADVEGITAGFGCLIPEKNELRACYVSPEFVGNGVGRKIVQELEKIATQYHCTYLAFDASLNAKEFYERCGYEVVEKSTHTSDAGLESACFKMKKLLNDGEIRT